MAHVLDLKHLLVWAWLVTMAQFETVGVAGNHTKNLTVQRTNGWSSPQGNLLLDSLGRYASIFA